MYKISVSNNLIKLRIFRKRYVFQNKINSLVDMKFKYKTKKISRLLEELLELKAVI